jgi:hypothetical protein
MNELWTNENIGVGNGQMSGLQEYFQMQGRFIDFCAFLSVNSAFL